MWAIAGIADLFGRLHGNASLGRLRQFFVALAVFVNPISVLPLFITVGQHDGAQQRVREEADRADAAPFQVACLTRLEDADSQSRTA